MTDVSARRPPVSPPAKLVVLSESDLPNLAQFIASQSGREAGAVENHLRWFLLENPARHPQIPLGCGLASPEGQLVGCILYVPQIFRWQAKTLLVLGSSSFYVDEPYRGTGGLIFLRFSELAAKWPLFGNSANADAARLWKARGAVPIPYSDHELFGVLRWRGVIEEALHRHRVSQPLSRVAAGAGAVLARSFKRLKFSSARSGNFNPGEVKEDLTQLTSADQVMQLPCIASPECHGLPNDRVTAQRDLPYIRWRYFSGRDSTVAVFAFRNSEAPSGVLVTVNQRPRGYRSQISTLNLLDIYPPASPSLSVSIIAALAARYRGAVDAIVLRSFDPELQEAFLHLGFLRRKLEAPNGWFLDKAGHLPTRDWYTVPADGDWLI